MITIHAIERHLANRRFEALLDCLASNGLELPLPLKLRLSQHPAAAVGLALRRVAELTYGPTALSRQMLDLLAQAQGADGAIDADPLAIAAAVAGWSKAIAEHRIDDHALLLARERALAALAALQQPDGLFLSPADRSQQDRALIASFILYLLAGDPDFRGAIRFADLMTWFEQHRASLPSDARTFWLLARLDTTPAPALGKNPTPAPALGKNPTPALDAIAA